MEIKSKEPLMPKVASSLEDKLTGITHSDQKEIVEQINNPAKKKELQDAINFIYKDEGRKKDILFYTYLKSIYSGNPDDIYCTLASDPKYPADLRLRAAKNIKDKDLADNAFLCIAGDSSVSEYFRIQAAGGMKNQETANKIFESIAMDSKYEAGDRIEAAMRAGDDALVLIASDSTLEIRDRIKAACNIKDAGKEFEAYSSIIINLPWIDAQKVLTSISNRIKQADDYKHNHSPEADNQKKLEQMRYAKINENLLKKYLQEGSFEEGDLILVYYYAINNNLFDFVKEAIHASTEGLNKAAKEKTLQQKLSAAIVYMSFDKTIEEQEFRKLMYDFSQITEMKSQERNIERFFWCFLKENQPKRTQDFAHEILKNPIWSKDVYKSVLTNQLPIDSKFMDQDFKELITEVIQSNKTCSPALCDALLELYMPLDGRADSAQEILNRISDETKKEFIEGIAFNTTSSNILPLEVRESLIKLEYIKDKEERQKLLKEMYEFINGIRFKTVKVAPGSASFD